MSNKNTTKAAKSVEKKHSHCSAYTRSAHSKDFRRHILTSVLARVINYLADSNPVGCTGKLQC